MIIEIIEIIKIMELMKHESKDTIQVKNAYGKVQGRTFRTDEQTDRPLVGC